MSQFTENLQFFTIRNLIRLSEIYDCVRTDGLPYDFANDRVRPILYPDSNIVSLMNSEYQQATINDRTGKLETVIYDCDTGREYFQSDE